MKFMGKLFSRVVLVSLAIAIQLVWLFLIMWFLSDIYLPIALVLTLISIVATVAIINRSGSPGVKLAWIVPIMTFPLFGGIIFFISGGKGPKKKLRLALEKSSAFTAAHYVTNYHPRPTDIRGKDRYIWGQCRYIQDSGYPIYRDTDASYFDDGLPGWERMLEDLRRAEKFIFLEYFILAPGKMWGAVLEILKEKQAAGVDVRVMYDDMGSISALPRKYHRQLETEGIPCVSFNRYRPVYSVIMNNRDHRKILVIDGNVAYTGGSNLADEYIGETVRFGRWKDNFLRLEGEGVRSMTLMFLEMWNAARPTDTPDDINSFMPDPTHSETVRCEGLVLPYGTFPVKNETMAADVYLNLINEATEYVYIFTPYLVVDYEMSRALCLAARRGVDVRIVVPAIPDKKIVYHLTQSFFPELMESGVTIYKYTPGFVHSKCFVVDDRLAVVGTINMDYRSLIQHFENACLFVDHPVVAEVRADFEHTFPECEVQMPKVRRLHVLYDLYLAILRLFSPLL